MTGKRTFTDNMTKLAVYVSVGIGIGTALFLLIFRIPAIFCLAVGGGAFLLFAPILLLAFSFMTTRRVTCDWSMCEVTTKGKWRALGSKQFLWEEVTATKIVEQEHESIDESWNSVHLFVVVNGDEIELLRKQNMTNDFASLVATVNRVTPHLPYVWVQPKKANDLRVLQDGQYYCKVARSQA